MSLEERTGERKLDYSRWHRPASISRFMTPEEARRLSCFDVDMVEVCARCKQPLALFETCFDHGQDKNTAWVTALAKRAGLPAYLAMYTTGKDGDIVKFRVRRTDIPGQIKLVTPERFARSLLMLRDKCPTCHTDVTRDKRDSHA